MNNKQKVVVGLSGGVDSSVAALLLKQQGYDVIGVFMQNWDSITNFENNYHSEFSKCDAQLDFEDAQLVAKKLDIPLYKKDFIKEYWDNVFLDFLQKYKDNLTPNPDIFCNKYIKFDAFLKYALKEFNCDYIATGHYANVIKKNNKYYLLTAKDDNKDQTYFLCHLNNYQLSKTLFPLANLTKNEVRDIAHKNNLLNYNKKDSVGICFIGERNLKNFLSNYIEPKQGNIIDITNNNVIGTHNGAYFYTIGQRKGLNIGGQKEKYFVCKKQNNDIFVAPNSLEHKYLQTNFCVLNNFNWIYKPFIKTNILARFRHRQPLQKVKIKIKNNLVYVYYPEQKNIVCGQYCVLYKDNKCLGGGEIIETKLV